MVICCPGICILKPVFPGLSRNAPFCGFLLVNCAKKSCNSKSTPNPHNLGQCDIFAKISMPSKHFVNSMRATFHLRLWRDDIKRVCWAYKSGFIFEHLARNPRFDNVTRRPGYSRGPSGFLPVSIEGMSFFIGLFLKEKGTFGFLGALSPSKSPKSQKDLFSRKQTIKKWHSLWHSKNLRGVKNIRYGLWHCRGVE